jgi:hypothetical protein
MRDFIAAFSCATEPVGYRTRLLSLRAYWRYIFVRFACFVTFCIVPVTRLGENPMTLSTHLQPIVALIAGVLILIMPRLLNFIVAIYLILVGIIGLGIIK